MKTWVCWMETTLSRDAPGLWHPMLIRSGGAAMIVAGLLVLATIALIPLLVPSLAPSSVAAGLQSIQSQALLYSLTWVLYLVSDLLFASAFAALYFALKSTNRTAMLVGVILNSLFVVLDVALDIPLRLSLVSFANAYSVAQAGAQQASVSAAAQTIMNASNLVALVATVCQFSAVIIASLVMLKSGTFKRAISYLGVVCGVAATSSSRLSSGVAPSCPGSSTSVDSCSWWSGASGRALGFAGSDCQN